MEEATFTLSNTTSYGVDTSFPHSSNFSKGFPLVNSSLSIPNLPLVNRPSPRYESLFPIRRCHKAYQIRLQPTTAQKEQLEKTFGCTRYVYNHFLARRKSLWQDEGQTLNYSACSKELTELKNQEETHWLKEVDKFALQNA